MLYVCVLACDNLKINYDQYAQSTTLPINELYLWQGVVVIGFTKAFE